jgi:type IV fimbrial biogenesis protein FimT
VLTITSKPTQSGFSLVELMIGIAILAILAGVAVPSFQTWLLNSQIRNAAESIANGLQRARAEAVGRNTDIELEFSSNSTWVLRIAGGDDIETRSNSEGSKSVLVSFTPNGTSKVTYNGLGNFNAANNDGSARITTIDVDSTILPASESQELRITTQIGGSIRMCDPNAPSGNSRAC